MSPKRLRLLSCATLGLGVASVLYLLYDAGGERAFDSIVIWPLAPYFVALIPVLFPQDHFGAVVVLIGCAFLVVASACIYCYVVYVETGSYRGLIFLLLPIWQLAFCVVLLICACIASRFRTRGNDTRAA